MNDNAKVANSQSRVVFQNRKKNTEAIRNPAATTPERNWYISIELPDEAVQQRSQRDQSRRETHGPQVDGVGQKHQIDHHEKVVDRKQHETDRGPQQKRGAGAQIAAH